MTGDNVQTAELHPEIVERVGALTSSENFREATHSERLGFLTVEVGDLARAVLGQEYQGELLLDEIVYELRGIAAHVLAWAEQIGAVEA